MNPSTPWDTATAPQPCPHPTLVAHYSHGTLTVHVTCWACNALVYTMTRPPLPILTPPKERPTC